MKKVKRLSALVLCIVVCMMLLTGCGGNKYEDSAYLGSWSADTASMSGITISPEDVIGGEFTFTLEASGKCTVNIAGDETSGSWDETEDGFSVEDEFFFVVDGDVATMDYSGVTFEFIRN